VTKSLNRFLAVKADGNLLEAIGDISDNCVNFTDDSALQKQTLTAPSKWMGVNFICDMGNTLRNVIGTGSTDGLNTVTVTGPSGTHRYSLIYTDHSGRPNDETLVTVIRTFRAL
jgi:hypothetical protein